MTVVRAAGSRALGRVPQGIPAGRCEAASGMRCNFTQSDALYAIKPILRCLTYITHFTQPYALYALYASLLSLRTLRGAQICYAALRNLTHFTHLLTLRNRMLVTQHDLFFLYLRSTTYRNSLDALYAALLTLRILLILTLLTQFTRSSNLVTQLYAKAKKFTQLYAKGKYFTQALRGAA